MAETGTDIRRGQTWRSTLTEIDVAVLNIKARLGAMFGFFFSAIVVLELSPGQVALMSVLCFGLLLPYNLWVLRSAKNGNPFHSLLPWVDALVLTTIAATIREVIPHTIVIGVAQLAIGCTLFSPKRAMFAVSAQTVAIQMVALADGKFNGTGLLTFALLAPGIAFTSQLVRTHEATLREALRSEATTDALTGLPNRVWVRQRFQVLIDAAAQTNTQLAVFLVDLNGFSEVNDTLGHDTGDELLRRVADRLRAQTPFLELVRLGGDEFALIANVENRAAAIKRAERLIETLAEPLDFADTSLLPRAAVGIAVYPEDGTTEQELWRRSDNALRSAKRNGKPYDFDKSMITDDERRRRLQLVGEIPDAIEANEFVLFHQPKVDLQSGVVVGSEALLRWQHPTHGLLAPYAFIELAEVSGLIVPLTRWVVAEAIRQVAEWSERFPTLVVAVNVSARDLSDPTFAAFVESELRRHEVLGPQITFELTEREVMSDQGPARDTMNQLRNMGSRISIDDFGTGYSSLGYLHRLPVDEVKVDRSFVSEIRSSDNARKLVRSVINLARDLGLETVAEGVEHDEESAVLRYLGCDRAQGYRFARPMAIDAFEAFLTEHQKVNAPK